MIKQFNSGHPDRIDKPMRLAQLNETESMLVSPRNGNANGLPEPLRVGSPEHTEELNAIIEAGFEVERGNWPTKYFEFCNVDPEPADFLKMAGISKADPQGACNFVQMDAPDELFRAMITWANAEKIPLVHEQPNCIDFLGRNVHAMTQFQLFVSESMEQAFEAKGQFLQARPGELVCKNLSPYPHPDHAEDPAGHGTFAGTANMTFNFLFKPDKAQQYQALNGTLMLAHFRDIARMHVRSASRRGFDLGMRKIGPPSKIQMLNYFTRWAK